MIMLFKKYLSYFIAPNQNYSKDLELNLSESILLCWPIFMAHSLFSFIGLVPLRYFQLFNISGKIFPSLIKLNIFFILMEVLFFPLIIYFYSKYWMVLISLLGHLFNYTPSHEFKNKVDAIVIRSNSSYLLLLVPIIGGLLRPFGQIIFLVLGVRSQLNFNRPQCVFLIISPLIIFSFLMLLFSMSLIFPFLFLKF